MADIPSEKHSVMFSTEFNMFRGKAFEVLVRTQDEIRPIMEKIQKSAKARLKKNGSEDTLALSDSLIIKYQNRTAKRRTWVGVGVDAEFERKGKDDKTRRPVKYAHLVEKGFTYMRHKGQASNIEAKPFLKPAVNDVGGEDYIVERLKDITYSTILGKPMQGGLDFGGGE